LDRDFAYDKLNLSEMKRKLESRKFSETEKMLNKLKQYSEEKEQEVYVTLSAVVLATLLIK